VAPLSSVAFFSLENQAKRRKSFFNFPFKNVVNFDLVLHSRFKTKQSLRSDVDRTTDKMTTVTLWRMHADNIHREISQEATACLSSENWPCWLRRLCINHFLSIMMVAVESHVAYFGVHL